MSLALLLYKLDKTPNLEYPTVELSKRLVEGDLEWYCIFLKAELSCIEDSPTLEKSDKLTRPLLSEGDMTKCAGETDKFCRLLPWYDFQKEFASEFCADELLYFIEFPTKVE